MTHPSVFAMLGALFREAGVRCVLIGGYAVIAHKVPRNTLDVDFMITSEDYEKIAGRLRQEGYEVANRQDAFLQLKGAGAGLRDLDFMLADRHTVDSIMSTGAAVTIAGESFAIPSVNHLIALKLHSMRHNRHRELNDLPDVVNLIGANGIDADAPEFKELCLKYGTAELYAAVKSRL